MEHRALDWRWELLGPTGSAVDAAEVEQEGQMFVSQSDAETWLGEMWPDLAAAGVAAVVLRRAERRVYGPMPLTPER